MKIFKIGIIAFCLISTALIISDQLFYKLWLVPKLPEMQSVPLWMWGVVLSPIILSIIILGWKIVSWKELVVVALISSFCSQAFEYISAQYNQLGHLKSFAVEDFTYFITIISAIVFLKYILGLGSVSLAKYIYKTKLARLTSRSRQKEGGQAS